MQRAQRLHPDIGIGTVQRGHHLPVGRFEGVKQGARRQGFELRQPLVNQLVKRAQHQRAVDAFDGIAQLIELGQHRPGQRRAIKTPDAVAKFKPGIQHRLHALGELCIQVGKLDF